MDLTSLLQNSAWQYCTASLADFLERTKQQYGPVVGLLLGGERVVLVADPAAAKTVRRRGVAAGPGCLLAGARSSNNVLSWCLGAAGAD